jgi:transposase
MKNETFTLEALIELMTHQQELLSEKDKTITYLQEKIDYLIRQKFASSSEKFPSNQPSLFEVAPSEVLLVEEDPEVEKISYVRKKRGGKTTPPDSLPHVRIEHDLEENEKVCSCGCAMKRIKEIVSHQYDIIPATFRVIDNVRFVYACECKCGTAPKTAPLAPQVLPRHQVTPSFLATIAVQKFEDALPLVRQAKMYKHRFGVAFTDTTFSDWMIKASKLWLEPLMNRLHALQLQSGYIQMDETTLQVLKEKEKKAQSKSYLWLRASHSPSPIVLLHYSSNRSGATAEFLLKGFSGYLQSDGYGGYNSVANQVEVTQLGCWAHVL